MSRKVVVKITWSIKKPLEMAAFAIGTVVAMSDNKYFLTPDIDMITMSDSSNRVQFAFGNKKNGAIAKDELNTAIKTLNTHLHDQAEYVNDIANGNATITHSAGFMSTSDIRGLGIKPNAVELVKLKATSNGGMKAQVAKVDGATNYCFLLVTNGVFDITVVNGEIFIPSGTTVRIINTTKRTAYFEGLTPMEIVYVAVLASNATGDNGLSPVAKASTIL